MLESMRRQGASIFVYIIFGGLAAIFIVNIGPQSGRGGCKGTDNVIISVNNEEATQTAYHIAYSNRYNQATGKQKTWLALERLIEREILAQEAESRGLMATDTMIDNEIKQGHFFVAGQRVSIPGAIQDVDGEKFYNHQAVKGWANELNVSLNSYREEQKRSMLAAMMAEILQESVVVSREEALNAFLFEGNTATYDVVKFSPETYRSAMKITDADVDRFIATHGPEIEARYKQDERTYKAVKPQLFLRQIFIAKPAAAGSGSAAAPDEGKAKLEAARAAIGTNKAKFAEQAKTLNSEEAMRNAAGELGWRTAENPMLGDKALSDAVKTLKPGEMTPVITTDKGSYLIMAEDKREGDLSFDQVKREIAKELARDVWGKEAAKRAAIAALEGARNGVGANLDQLYEKEKQPEGPGNNIQELFQKIQNDPNLTPEQKQQQIQQLLQMLQQQQGGGESGMIEVESKDIPAGWFADADGAGGGSAKAPAAGSSAPAAGSAAPSAGSASGSAAAAGSGAAAAPAATPSVEEANTPSKDQLPAMTEVEKPHVVRVGPTPRSTTMPGLGNSKAAQDAVFEDLEPGRLANKVYEADGGYVVVQLIARSKPNIADFDKDADQRVAELRAHRANAFLTEWLKQRCETLAKDGKIRPNPELIAEHDDQGRLLPTQYRPCISFH